MSYYFITLQSRKTLFRIFCFSFLKIKADKRHNTNCLSEHFRHVLTILIMNYGQVSFHRPYSSAVQRFWCCGLILKPRAAIVLKFSEHYKLHKCTARPSYPLSSIKHSHLAPDCPPHDDDPQPIGRLSEILLREIIIVEF